MATSTILQFPQPLAAPSSLRRETPSSASTTFSQARAGGLARRRQRVDESEQERINRLGTERPPEFKSLWRECAFVYSICASQFMAEYFVSGFNVLVPSLQTALDIPQSAAVWPSAAFALVTSAFLLPFGRLSDMYGGHVIYMFGLVWFCVWSLIAGFAQNEQMLVWCRAIQGLGPAAFLPSGVMLMGSIYRPGPRKNLVFGLYGGAAPFGFFAGVLVAGISATFLSFGWYFFLGSILVGSTVVAAALAVPSDRHVQRQVTGDLLGSCLLVAGMLLTIFALTDGSHAPKKWATPYIYSTLIAGISFLAAFIYVEGRIAKNPLMPADLFAVPYLKPLFVALLFTYGCLGVYLLYAIEYMSNILNTTPIQLAAWTTPMCIGGIALSIGGGYILHLISGTVLILISSCGWILSAVMFALAPAVTTHHTRTQIYWAYIFPAMLGATIGIDIAFNVANVFITSNLPKRRQGLGGALMNVLLYGGIALLLAGADTVQTEAVARGGTLLESYRAVFWYMLACAAVSLGVEVLWVRVPKAESGLTIDERETQQENSLSLLAIDT